MSAGLLIPALILFSLLTSCRSTDRFPPYSPHDNLLSITAEFQLLSARDPYRDGPAPDLTGRNIARATFIRLANYEDLHPGRLTPEVLTLKARALEWLGDYQGSRRAYLDAAEYDSPLRGENLARADYLLELLIILDSPPPESLEPMIVFMANQARELRALASRAENDILRGIVLREAEAAEVRRAELMAANRWMLPDGEEQALQALTNVVSNHRESHRAMEHALRLARYHKSLAEEEFRIRPPDGLEFNRERFQRHFDAAADLLYRVSQADGRPERKIARHELDALLNFGQMVQEKAR